MAQKNYGETMSLILAPTLKSLNNHEREIGKKFVDWSDEEKTEFIINYVKDKKTSEGDSKKEEKTSYIVESTFKTSNPKVERRRIAVKYATTNIIRGIVTLGGPIIWGFTTGAGSMLLQDGCGVLGWSTMVSAAVLIYTSMRTGKKFLEELDCGIPYSIFEKQNVEVETKKEEEGKIK